MTDKVKNILVCIVFALVLFGFFLTALLKPEKEISESERRSLNKFPEISMTDIMNGRFMEKFEDYAKDQFPLRENFRSMKAQTAMKLFKKKDNNGIYMEKGYLSALEYPLNMDSVNNFTNKINSVYEKYISGKDMRVFYSVIPDKNYFLAKEYEYPVMDYEKLIDSLKKEFSYMEYIDIWECLQIEDYYKTDTHWKQENIIEAAQLIGKKMGTDLSCNYEIKKLNYPFYGVYSGQSALKIKPDTLNYLSNDTINSLKVYNYENGKATAVYDMEKAYSNDPYEMFLSGPVSLISMENPEINNGRELIIFRDSFGSAIAPLFAEGYEKLILVDIRYIRSDILEKYIKFENQDVLFLYSTLVINNSETFK